MPRRLFIAGFALLGTIGAHAETLDRIAVTVGRHVISERDVVEDIRISAFLDGKAPESSGDQKRKAADRLIDRYLVLEDAALTRAALPSPADIAAMLAPVKARYGSEQEYRSALAQTQIGEVKLSEHLLAGLRMLRYTDLRFRPEVQLSEAEIRAYYDKLAPAQTFDASRDDIEKLLIDQRTLQALDRWLGMTRSETPILYREAVFK